MSKRISKTVTLALVLATFIAFLYITPSQACVPPPPPPPPNVEIWKEFLPTSDPPPYQMGIEYHWDIEVGVSTKVDLKDAKVSDNFGAELKIDEIVTLDKTYIFTYLDYESKYPTNEAKVTIGDVGTFKLNNWWGVTFGKTPYKFHIDWSGQTHKIHFEWYIDELKAGKTITVTIGISTDLNPGGKQEYTSSCEHCINSGAVLKAIWRDRCRCRCISAESEQLYVKVQCEVPRPAKLILDKFNDTNGNGIYDDGDIKIPNWKIDVKDPDGITTSYLTPKTIDITEFGTYTATEELPSNWEQTALRVDGAYLAPTVTTSVLINEGETHEVLYGNKLRPLLQAKLTIQKFNDTDNDGVYDAGTDPLITWTVNVKDPDGITTTYTTPVDLVITKFGTYTITEDLPSGWIQTAVYVDGVLVSPPTLTVTVEINLGETHNVLYGNFEIPLPPPIKVWMSLVPISQKVGSNIAFSWEVLTIRPDVIPQKVELKLVKPDGTSFILHTATNFPTDYEGTKNWAATLPTGTWWIFITYTYTYYGTTYTAGTFGSFTVTS